MDDARVEAGELEQVGDEALDAILKLLNRPQALHDVRDVVVGQVACLGRNALAHELRHDGERGHGRLDLVRDVGEAVREPVSLGGKLLGGEVEALDGFLELAGEDRKLTFVHGGELERSVPVETVVKAACQQGDSAIAGAGEQGERDCQQSCGPEHP